MRYSYNNLNDFFLFYKNNIKFLDSTLDNKILNENAELRKLDKNNNLTGCRIDLKIVFK